MKLLNSLLLISVFIILPKTTLAQSKSDFVTAQAQENELNSEKAYIQRALIHEKQGNYESALEDYSRAIEVNPNMAEAYNNRGLIFMRKGDYELASADYSRAIEIDPNVPGLYVNRGNAYIKQGITEGNVSKDEGKGELAFSDWQKAIQLYTDEGNVIKAEELQDIVEKIFLQN